MSLLLALSLLVLPGSAGSSEALGLPGRNPRPIDGQAVPPGRPSPGGLQEVAPPLAVQQLQEALAQRQPRVEILAPADDSLLPPGPWTLRLRVQDWPLVDGGALGLGPHLVVQVDNEQPLPLTSTERTMPPLAPGSHRLTVFAARPWGEAAKNPGAWSQIRLHRTAANPPELPEPGRVQLIPVSPAATAASEPLLLDWLLLDAPLQNLRGDDARWRLRVSINGDGLVLDRQTPLWLKGWKPGRNAIRFELLDGRGEPLNPPYNSLVREVELDPGTPLASWQRGALSPGELAILLGEAAPEPPLASNADAAPRPREAPSPGASEPMERGQEILTSPGPGPAAEFDPPPAVRGAMAEPTPDRRAAGEIPSTAPERSERLSDRDQPAAAEPGSGATSPERDSAPQSPDPPSEREPAGTIPASEPLAGPSEPSRTGTAAPEGLPAAPRPGPWGLDRSTALNSGAPAEGSVAPSPPSPWPGTNPPADGRLRPSSSLEGSARDQLNEDGTMVRPPRRGPLAGLRERLLP